MEENSKVGLPENLMAGGDISEATNVLPNCSSQADF
jgi:hypothetical protein